MKLRPVLAAVAIALPLWSVASADATDGNIYVQGPQPTWFIGSGATSSQVQPGVWQVNFPAQSPAYAGKKWEMGWACPGGTEAAYVAWSGLRYSTPSALGIDVTSGEQLIHRVPDVQLPQSPAGGAQYATAIPSGRCNVALSVVQGQTVQQHARVYWIGNPHAAFRDLTAPTVALRNPPAGWVNGSASSIAIGWAATDNFGSDGMLLHRAHIGGLSVWGGAPGQGDHVVTVPLAGVADGAQELVVSVEGDGTAAGRAAQTIFVDRTNPQSSGPEALPTTTPGTSGFRWYAQDATSGVDVSTVEVNTATNGSTTGEWTTVARSAGAGEKTVATADLSGFADGVHATRVRIVDLANNVAYSAQGEVVIDRTAPTVTVAPAPTIPVRTLSIAFTIADNLAAHWGLGETRVAVNASPDGSSAGQWTSETRESLAAGAHTRALDLSGLADGPHLVRISTLNGGPAGPSLVGSASVVVQVDATPPTVTEAAIRRVTAEQISAKWIARDTRSGVAAARIEWLDGAVWRRLISAPASDGVGQVTAETKLVPNGRHAFRLVVADAAGNETFSGGPIDGIAVDNTPPSLTGLQLSGPPWIVQWRTETGDIGACKATISLNGGGTSGTWREVGSIASPAGTNVFTIPTTGLAPGSYRVRVVVCDAAGNTATSETAGLVVSDAVSGGPFAGDPALAGARLTLNVPGHPSVRAGKARRVTVVLRYGRRVRVTGRLVTAKGAPIRGAQIVVTGTGGLRIGRVATSSSGRFALALRPTQSGAVSWGVESAGEITPVSATPGVRLRVTPTVSLAASTRSVAAGGRPVVFTGRMSPSPSQLRLTDDKAVILEWRDPSRNVWRPIVNDVLQPDGTFRLEWQFQAKGQRIPVRVRVPRELGWHLDEGRSASVIVRVR